MDYVPAGPAPTLAAMPRTRALVVPDNGSGCGCKDKDKDAGTGATAASPGNWHKRDPLDADDIIKSVVTGVITALALGLILGGRR